MEKLSFVIPCYRSEHTIETVVNEINTVMQKHSQYNYEIILINDSSPDDLWGKLKILCTNQDNIIAVNLARNFGQHSALMAGYRLCKGDYVVTLDDDGQTPAFETFTLLDKLNKGYDVVYGHYLERKDASFRKIGTYLNNFMLENIIGKPKGIHLTSFFVARRYVIEEICKYKNPYPYIWGLIVRTTKSITNVTIQHRSRDKGESGYTLGKLLNLWLNGFTAFSVKPLRIATCCGGIISILGFSFTVYTIINKLLHPSITSGYASLMCAILIVGGILMLLLGMIGEYIGRIYICLNDSPQYVTKEIFKRSVNDERNDN